MDDKHLFPNFLPITPENRSLYESFLSHEELYSDSNFTSLYSWDAYKQNGYSIHNKNLVLRLTDYLSNETIYSLIGTQDIDETLLELLNDPEYSSSSNAIHLVPEMTVHNIQNKDNFIIREELDNFDYIYNLEDIATLRGRSFKSKRQSANRCERNTALTMQSHKMLSSDIADVLLHMLDEWVEHKVVNGKEIEDSRNELAALNKVLEIFDATEKLELSTISDGSKLVGFSIDEFATDKHVLSHYCKTLPTITGLAELFNRNMARAFLSKGYKYWNWEQDTGSEKLRRIKLSYRPNHYSKKYSISLQ